MYEGTVGPISQNRGRHPGGVSLGRFFEGGGAKSYIEANQPARSKASIRTKQYRLMPI
jgi:hypothetical protein